MTVRRFAYFKRKISDINRILDADEERSQVIELQSIKKELMEVQESFSSAIDEISTLSQFLDRSISDERFYVNGKEALSKIRMRYARNQTDQAVKEGRHFANLIDASSEAIKAKDKALEDAKKTFKKINLASCDSPAMIKLGLVMTASNEKTFAAYDRSYTELLAKIDAMGRVEFLESLSELQKSCRELEKIFAEFETDYPEFVDEFMKLVRTSRAGVKLTDLSIEQFEWLKDNGLADQFKVIPN